MMATFSNPTENLYDNVNQRSPRPYQNSTINRHMGRNDAYGSIHGGLFNNDGSFPGMRFDTGRDPFGAPGQPHAGGNVHFPYDPTAAQTWSSSSAPFSPIGNGMGPMNNYGPSRTVKTSRGRTGISNLWYDQHPPMPPPASMNHNRAGLQIRHDSHSHEDDEELIPTAIVIKNIPFAVKKEQLVQLMVDMNLPLPYAFNYHFDNGVFRGLAFANFTSASETEQVIQALNHMELSGRKLRVEYKKMLPLAERERIEREKRERRGQLEEQHRPMGQGQLHNQASLSSIPRNTPSPLSHRSGKPDIDMNDPKTLEFYTEMTLFRRDPSREVLIFPSTLEPHHRRIVHTLAHHMGLMHTSRGSGDQRQVHIHRAAPGTNVSPPTISGAFPAPDGMRPNMGRTSNADFNENRQYEPPAFNTLRGQSSVGLLDVMDSGPYSRLADNNLRNAKSFADLRSWSPSPVPSTASFPAALQTNGARLQSLNETAGTNTPTQASAGANVSTTANANNNANANNALSRDEPFLISSFSNLAVGGNTNNQMSPRRQRSFFSNTPSWEDTQSFQPTAPIGSKRTVSIGGENNTQDRLPMRQARGPSSGNPIGFRRQNGRDSDEMRNTTSAIAE